MGIFFASSRHHDLGHGEIEYSKLTDRGLGILERWLEKRTRADRARLDRAMQGASRRIAYGEEAQPWWRSWRSCKRHR